MRITRIFFTSLFALLLVVAIVAPSHAQGAEVRKLTTVATEAAGH